MSLWGAHLIDVRSGRVGARLDVTADAGSWRETLNAIPEWDVKVGKESLSTVPEDDLLPWANGVVVTFDGEPLLAGPITKPYSEDRTTVTLSCAGIEQTLAGWRVLPRNYTKGGDLREDAPLRFEGLTLGEIQWRLVLTQMQRLVMLPIRHGVPATTGTRQRTYETWNLSNNQLLERIREVAHVIGGPDFAFWPQWSQRGSRVEWLMVHGTGDEWLPQTHEPAIDLAAASGPVASFAPIAEWEPVTTVYGVGAGQGAGTLISVQRQELDIPAIEDVLSDTGTDNWDLVQEHARAEGRSRLEPVHQLSVTLDAVHPSAGLGLWRCGQVAQVKTGPGWRRVLPSGSWRAIARHGRIGASTYTVELQEA